jgi:ribonuclease HI
MLRAWFDGACEPVNPGGVATWGFIVRDDDTLIAKSSGLVDAPAAEQTNNVAEYEALEHLLKYLVRAHADADATIHGDSTLVLEQVKGTWKANKPHLAGRRDRCQALLKALGKVELVRVMREQNVEADALTHEAYVAALDKDPELLARLAPALAGEREKALLLANGIEWYPYMGRREAFRLLERARKPPQ